MSCLLFPLENMSTTLYILTILSCIACISRLGHCLDEKAKNVIIFIADDLGYSDLSCFGNELIQTPNIDKLAKNGLKLTRMYSMPSEAGSLAAIYTGMFTKFQALWERKWVADRCC